MVTEGVDVVETNAATSGAINISLPSVEGPARGVAHQVRAAALAVARLAKAAATRAVCHLEVPVAALMAVARLVKEAVAVCHLLEVLVAVARQAKAAALAVARLLVKEAVAVVDLETVEKETVAVVDLETVEAEDALAAARRVIPRKSMTRVIRN